MVGNVDTLGQNFRRSETRQMVSFLDFLAALYSSLPLFRFIEIDGYCAIFLYGSSSLTVCLQLIEMSLISISAGSLFTWLLTRSILYVSSSTLVPASVVVQLITITPERLLGTGPALVPCDETNAGTINMSGNLRTLSPLAGAA